MGSFTEKLEFLISVNGAAALGAMKDFEKSASDSLDKVESKGAKFSDGALKWGAGIMAASTVAIGGLKKLGDQYDDAQAQSLKLDATMRTMPQLADANRQAFDDLANSLQKKAMADGDAVTGAESLLGQMGLTQDQILKVTPLVNDLAVKMGVDLDTAARAVAKSVDGTTGGLKKMGVNVDETMAKGDAFAATMDALGKSVGGFAEEKAKTFNGQLETLKNNLGDIGENVGKGAQESLSMLLTPVSGLVEQFRDLDPAIQENIGRIAGFAAVAGEGAGALLTLAGTIGKGIQGLDTLKGKLRDDSGELTKFGSIAKGLGAGLGIAVGVTAAVEAALALNNALHDAKKTVDDFAQMSAGKLLATFTQFNDIVAKFGTGSILTKELTDNLNTLANGGQTGLGVLIKLMDAYKGNTQIQALLAEAYDRNILNQRNLNEAQQAGASAAASAALASQSLADGANTLGQATSGATLRLKEERDAANEANTKLRALMDTTLAAFSADLQYESSTHSVRDAVDALNAKTLELLATNANHEATTVEVYQAQKDYEGALTAAKQAALEQAGAAVELATKNAELEGKTLDAKDAAKIERDELQKIADTLAPDNPLRKQLDAYIAQLNKTTGDFNGKVNLDTSPAMASLRALGLEIDDVAAKLASLNAGTTSSLHAAGVDTTNNAYTGMSDASLWAYHMQLLAQAQAGDRQANYQDGAVMSEIQRREANDPGWYDRVTNPPPDSGNRKSHGGPVVRGMTYLVGETGPELYVGPGGPLVIGGNGPVMWTAPGTGTVVPNSKSGYSANASDVVGVAPPAPDNPYTGSEWKVPGNGAVAVGAPNDSGMVGAPQRHGSSKNNGPDPAFDLSGGTGTTDWGSIYATASKRFNPAGYNPATGQWGGDVIDMGLLPQATADFINAQKDALKAQLGSAAYYQLMGMSFAGPAAYGSYAQGAGAFTMFGGQPLGSTAGVGGAPTGVSYTKGAKVENHFHFGDVYGIDDFHAQLQEVSRRLNMGGVRYGGPVQR